MRSLKEVNFLGLMFANQNKRVDWYKVTQRSQYDMYTKAYMENCHCKSLTLGSLDPKEFDSSRNIVVCEGEHELMLMDVEEDIKIQRYRS